MKTFIERLKNPGTFMALGCAVVALFIQFGIDIDVKWAEETVSIICTIGVLVGIMNNPETDGIDFISKK